MILARLGVQIELVQKTRSKRIPCTARLQALTGMMSNPGSRSLNLIPELGQFLHYNQREYRQVE